jgi:hypothetical protein
MTEDVTTIGKMAPTVKIGKVRQIPDGPCDALLMPRVAMDSPPPAHDELDTAE